jgi:hypothetical protein
LELVGLGRGIFNTNPIICFRINWEKSWAVGEIQAEIWAGDFQCIVMLQNVTADGF